MRPIHSLVLAGIVLAVAGCTSHQDVQTPPSPPPSAPGGTGSAGGDGGSAGTLKIGMMPKSKGIPYFNACQKGAEEAAKELGDVELTFDGPTEDRSDAQSNMVDSWISRKLDAIAIACNDKDQIASTLARARDAGINVVTYDSDANPESSKRQFFVNQAGVEEIAEALVDEMAKQAGEDAKVGVVSSSSTAPNQVSWLTAMDAYRQKKYPKMQVVVTEYAGEDDKKSQEKAKSILNAYPDVKGLWGMTSVAFPGAARAVKESGKSGQVAVVGLGTPNVMKEFVDAGVVKSVVLWNPVDLGYLTVQVAHATAKGELKSGATSFKAGRLGEVKVNGDQVMLGKPMVFTKENIGQFDF